ncbi:hypothetical protein FDI21_gp326 [Pseudomonas phage Noxifer]|uniref:Uncharacterized protein n=1 Tax=Pseudomonas phage Noxifer TaxID=2006684 RepID=A0A1Y0SXW2_9CAUD|nr:hypothetical protein FDI21_gp326 [Pseudomonas phage Noxifer]ARV77385.1 hypothetical protein NOXIFER_220 [Pseudomonas phage Noxifer]
MSNSIASLSGVQLVMPDGSRNDLNFGSPAMFSDRGDHLTLGIELDHMDYTLRISMRVDKADATVDQSCIGKHKETGEERPFKFMPRFQANINNLNRREPLSIEQTFDTLRERLKQYPASTLFGSQPTAPAPHPSKRKFP